MKFLNNINKTLLLGITLSLSLSACGNKQPPTAIDPSASMGLDGGLGGGLEPLDGGGFEPVDGGFGDPALGPDAGFADPGFADPGFADPAAQVPVAPPVEPAPPTDSAPAEPPAEDPNTGGELDADLGGDLGGDLDADLGGELPDLGDGGDDLGELPDLGDGGDGLGDLPDFGDGGDDLGELPDLGDGGLEDPFNPGDTGSSGYSLADSFQVDQDTFNQWQAVNIDSDGSSLYIAAIDLKSPTKGTVIQLDGSGESWKDIGKSFLSTVTLGAKGYDMENTIRAVAVDNSGNVVVADQQDKIYHYASGSFDTTEYAVGLNSASDAISINGDFYINTAFGVQKLNSSFGIPSTFGTTKPTGGLGKDSNGSLYAVVGSKIVKYNSAGNTSTVLANAGAPIDVAVDAQGNIFVLQSNSVKWFDAEGTEQGEFGNGEFTAARALCTDSSGNVYVADHGTDHKDSKILKFSN